ncbi:hypothetical protein ACWCYY_25595 [Kitasatospora sp. NPDC001664]
MRRITTLALAALLTAGCAATDAGHDIDRTPVPTTSGTALERAAQVAREWPGSEAERAWSDGYYPLDPRQEWLPPDAFTHGGKTAYLSGLIEPVTALPTAEATAEVVWVHGRRQALPMISPWQVLDGLAKGKPPCGADCEPPLKLTGVARGSRTVATSRGQATVPVWEFTIAGYQDPFVYPAVAPQQPPVGRPVQRWADRSVTYESVSADGLTVTGRVGRGSCERVTGTEAYETDRLVVLIAEVRRTQPQQQPCTLVLVTDRVTVKLTRPLDARLVLDLATGAPQGSW